MTDNPKIAVSKAAYEVCKEAYWLLAWSWQSHLFNAGNPFNMTVFAPEAYDMMNTGERNLFDALKNLEAAINAAK